MIAIAVFQAQIERFQNYLWILSQFPFSMHLFLRLALLPRVHADVHAQPNGRDRVEVGVNIT